jgi:hypothetical protein
MRRKAGPLIMTLLLLIVPALAHAWTLSVKVSGGTDTNNITVAYGTPPVQTTFKSTASYLYPIGAVTITDHAAASSMTFDGVAVVPATFVSPTSGNHTLAVAYATTQANSGLSFVQAEGGTLYAQNRNNTWTTSAVSGLVAGSSVPVTIAADANHRIVSYSLDGLPAIATGVTGAAGQSLPLTAYANGQVVRVNFALAGKTTASLFTPTAGTTGSAVTCTATASSNDSPASLRYAFAVTGQASFAQAASSSSSFSFTPSAPGTYYVTATVTTQSSGGSFTTPAATVVVATAQENANRSCVSCHSTQPSVHAIAGLQDSCRGCHSATPHDTTVATHSGASVANCSSCHAAKVTAVQASIHYTMPSTKLTCSNCHGAGSDPSFIATACAGCHATVDNHSTATMGTKACLDCHDGHNPTSGTAPLLGAVSAHPAVTLYTFEEIGMQMAGGAKVPVQVDASGKGMPYSPKQTCGTAGCHVKNGVDYTYDKISDHAFHSNQGRSEYQDSSNGKFDATKNKPWVQSTAMVGKW